MVTLDTRLPDDPGPWTSARIAEGEHAACVQGLARDADFTVLIAPETRGVLASLTRDLEHAGARTLGSTPNAVELAGDKARLATRLREIGVDTPATRIIVPGFGLPPDARYPAVLKPLDGAGSVDTFYLPDAHSLPAAARAMPEALLQPFVAGSPMSASFLVAPSGRAWLIGVGTQRMALRDGRITYRGGTLPRSCPGAVRQIRPALNAVVGMRGFVGVDFIWDAARRHATVLEINPRPTTSYVGLCRLLPPGLLARAWMSSCAPEVAGTVMLASLADQVCSQKCLSFGADGSVTQADIGDVA
jgi:predicted ATP-grasp superfamily ATP-dependent carboligase